jgi:hypothetical protein
MFGFTDDPVADFNRHDKEQQAAASRLPICVHCKKPIDEDEYYDIEGDCKCFKCLIKHHRKWTEDYIG